MWVECSCGLRLSSPGASGVTVSSNVYLVLEAVESGVLQSPAFCLQALPLTGGMSFPL